jgi:hypothetical protein
MRVKDKHAVAVAVVLGLFGLGSCGAARAGAGDLGDAGLVMVSGAAEVGYTEYKLRGGGGGLREAGLWKTTEGRIGAKVVTGAVAWVVIRETRRAGHPGRARVLSAAWVAMQVGPMVYNALQHGEGRK